MANTDKHIITIVRELYLSIQKHGYKRVLNKLNELKLPTFNEYEYNIQNRIINLVIVEYNITENELKKNNVRGDIGEARALCMVLLKKYLYVSHSQIAKIFKRDTHSMVSNALSKHKNKSETHQCDTRYLKKYRRIEKRLLEEIEQMTTL